MEQENTVSIWLGNVKTEDELIAYTTENYSEDGDELPSPFCQDFFNSDQPYEYDFLERFMVQNPSGDFTYFLAGCSYDESIIKSLKTVTLDATYNAVILIFDFAYQGNGETDDFPVHYIGSVSYEKCE